MSKAERRREPRSASSAAIRLFTEGPGAAEIAGRLLDKSKSGFRAVHDCRELATGDRIRFSLAKESGVARVVWTRIAAGGVESGFWVESA